jgi:putative restriction endonuclease
VTTISGFFRDTLGSPLSNTRWSWGASNLVTGQLFLRVWEDERKTINGTEYIAIFGSDWESKSPGLPERRRHVELLWQGIEGYGVLCTAVDPHSTGPREILAFDQERLIQFGSLRDDAGTTYAEIVARPLVEDVVSTKAQAIELEEDLEAIEADPLAVTMRRTLVDARIGQGAYRARVLRLWDGQCCVTGTRTLDAVRASHIKPWRDCTNVERLDPYNGLPLVGTLDALFDAGLITFSPTGDLEISTSLSSFEQTVLNLVGLRMKNPPSPKTIEYLKCHRAYFR